MSKLSDKEQFLRDVSRLPRALIDPESPSSEWLTRDDLEKAFDRRFVEYEHETEKKNRTLFWKLTIIFSLLAVFGMAVGLAFGSGEVATGAFLVSSIAAVMYFLIRVSALFRDSALKSENRVAYMRSVDTLLEARLEFAKMRRVEREREREREQNAAEAKREHDQNAAEITCTYEQSLAAIELSKQQRLVAQELARQQRLAEDEFAQEQRRAAQERAEQQRSAEHELERERERLAATRENLQTWQLSNSAPPIQHYGVSPSGAEDWICAWMLHMGAFGAQVTRHAGDGGIDVESAHYVAQVKHYTSSVAIAEVRAHIGVAAIDPMRRKALFFTSGLYPASAVEAADLAKMALFTYDVSTGVVTAVNSIASSYMNTSFNSDWWPDKPEAG